MLKTFSDLAVDVSTVVAVSKNVCSDGENRSTLVLAPKEGRELVLEISALAAESLIAFIKSQDVD